MKILVLTSRFPYPLDKGDKLRIYNQIRDLSRNNEVTLISLNRGKVSESRINELKKFCYKVHTFNLSKSILAANLARAVKSEIPFQVSIFYNPAFQKEITEIYGELKPDAVYCFLIRMAEYVKNFDDGLKTLDYMDAFSKGMERRADISKGLKKKFFFNEHKRLLSYEEKIAEYFNNTIVISEQDKDLIPSLKRSDIKIIPNGVDFEIFKPIEKEKKYDIIFSGHMAYPPNIEAAKYAAKKIIPLLMKDLPGIKMQIAGIEPPKEIRELESENVSVVTKFSHIRDTFAESRILLAPMLISIGLQNKILQAMAMKIPCICSTLANNAIKAPVGECIIEANSDKEYAEKIIYLLRNPEKANELAENAYNFVKEKFNWQTINSELEKILFSS